MHFSIKLSLYDLAFGVKPAPVTSVRTDFFMHHYYHQHLIYI